MFLNFVLTRSNVVNPICVIYSADNNVKFLFSNKAYTANLYVSASDMFGICTLKGPNVYESENFVEKFVERINIIEIFLKPCNILERRILNISLKDNNFIPLLAYFFHDL